MNEIKTVWLIMKDSLACIMVLILDLTSLNLTQPLRKTKISAPQGDLQPKLSMLQAPVKLALVKF